MKLIRPLIAASIVLALLCGVSQAAPSLNVSASLGYATLGNPPGIGGPRHDMEFVQLRMDLPLRLFDIGNNARIVAGPYVALTLFDLSDADVQIAAGLTAGVTFEKPRISLLLDGGFGYIPGGMEKIGGTFVSRRGNIREFRIRETDTTYHLGITARWWPWFLHHNLFLEGSAHHSSNGAHHGINFMNGHKGKERNYGINQIGVGLGVTHNLFGN